MSEVKRITVLWPVGPNGCGNYPVVLASEYDAAQAELAALREELAIIKDECIDHVNLHNAWTKQRNDIQQRLASAEQRNVDMLNWLRRQASAEKGSVAGYAFAEAFNALKKIADTKPTESGASE